MTWDDFRLILALIREKTVRGAAKTLGVSHATVSRRLAHLNSRPGGPFVQKSPSGLWPSKAGRVVFDAAEKMEQIVNEAARRQRAVNERLAGPLCLSIPNPVLQYLLLDAVTEFGAQFPGIDLTINATDQLVDLDRAEADVVIRTTEQPPEHWVGRRLFPYMLSLYAHRDYLEKTPPSEYRWIAPTEDTTRWADWLSESPFPNAPIGLRISSITGRFQALKRGLGMGRAACFMAELEPDLVRLPGAMSSAAETFWVLSHPDLAKTERARAAIRFFASKLKARQAVIQGTE
ncbi:MAG: LysR family transcriptional regulator [Pseudomonadota bacterium]